MRWSTLCGVVATGAAAATVGLVGCVVGGDEGESGFRIPGPAEELVVYGDGEIEVEDEAIEEEGFEPEGEGFGVASPITVGELIDRRGCSTALTMPLNAQIAAQMNCIEDGFFTHIDDIPNVALGPAANPFLQDPAADALRRVAASRPGSTFSITNSWRSVVQQYILDSWEGSCGIGIAAAPGHSNHESGLAIDVPLDTTTTFRSALRDQGFRWYCDATNGGRSSGCRDTPHHDYTRGGADLRSRSVLAFQQLWNRAHPEDRIAEDGDFGPQTARRIRLTPLAGFPTGATCTPPADPFCGDGSCDSDESCSTCPADCGACPVEPECGDGSCDSGESCSTCSADCGACPTGCTVEGAGGDGENGDPCTEAAETWRCVHSDHWDDWISQVCRSGRWVTYEIGPRDCEGCCGAYSTACRP